MKDILIIPFGLKFCQRQLTDFIGKRPGHSDQSFWELSISSDFNEIHFDLSITEWIATEEVTFLFAWMRKLLSLSKKVQIDLPYGYPIQRIFDREKIEKLQKIQGFIDNERRVKKRYNRNIFLMVNWGLLNNTGLQQANFKNLLERSVYNQRYDLLGDDDFNKVVPFSVIDASFDGNLVKFDDLFNEVLTGTRSKNSTLALFEVEKKVRDILANHGCYSAFESKVLSNVIFQELFLNTCQHSFNESIIKADQECFMAMSFAGKKNIGNSQRYTENLREEIDPECFDFYKDKERIRLEMIKDLKNYEKFKKLERRPAKLDKYTLVDDKPLLEYSFLDFGQGYAETLKEEYDLNKDKFIDQLNSQHIEASSDAQIIEYAYLLETSCIPISSNIENYNLIPRGLYFLIDMVRRFKGMLKIRSGNGMVIYDFSDKIYLEVNDHHPRVFIHAPYTVKECVSYGKVAGDGFPGNMISVTLPPKVFRQFKKETSRSLSPVRIDNGMLNRYVYYKNEFHFEDLDPQSYEYLSLLFLMNKVIEDYNAEEIKNRLHEQVSSKELNRLFYNRIYAELVNGLKKHNEKNCVIFIDFAQLPFDSQVLKLIYYLLDTPRINELTKAVLVNLDASRNNILDLLKKRFQHDPEAPQLYKALPCFSFSDITKLNTVKWIGLRDDRDEEMLTSVLFGKQISSEKLHSIKNAEGNMLYEYEGWVYSFLKQTEEDKTA